MVNCPYAPCGRNENCIGCRHDPQQRQMTAEEFNDICCHYGCGSCVHFSVNSDRSESTCKRLDHKRFKFAVPWFKSYDCGQQSAIKCAEFAPKEIYKWMHRHWKSEFLPKPNEKSTIGLVIDGDQSVRYYVKYSDFFNGTFIDDEGKLKWVKRCYYKKSPKSPIGYKLVWEVNE